MDNFRPSRDLLQRYLNSQCSEEERLLVDEWYQKLGVHLENPEIDSDENKLYDRIRRITAAGKNKTIPFYLRRLGVAASVLLVISLAFFTITRWDRTSTPTQSSIASENSVSSIDFKNNTKQVLLYTLPDSSTAQLLPGAQVSHPAQFLSDQRSVSFQGEAFFNIKRNEEAPFIIKSGNIETRVLGTSFNVKSDPQNTTFKIRVITGKVAVKINDENNAESIILTQNQQASVEPGQKSFLIEPFSTLIPEKDLWEPVSITYQDTPLHKVIGELQKTFGSRIELEHPSLGNCTITIELKNHNLPEILSMINLLLGTSYEIRQHVIFIKGESCGQ